LKDWEGKCISTTDLALCTALLVLATADRTRIRTELVDRTSFREALGDEQGWIMDLIRAFMDAHYGEVSRILQKQEPYLLLNPLLCANVSALIELIHSRSIVQYVSPFSSVQIQTMAGVFKMTEEEMMNTVEKMVEKGRIQGRIDGVDKVLKLTGKDPRAELYAKVAKVGKETYYATRAAALHLLLRQADIVVDPRPKVETGSMSQGAPGRPVAHSIGMGMFGATELTRPVGLGPTDSSESLEGVY